MLKNKEKKFLEEAQKEIAKPLQEKGILILRLDFLNEALLKIGKKYYLLEKEEEL